MSEQLKKLVLLKRRSSYTQKGVALVEFALLLSFFLLLVIGVIELSLLIFDASRAAEVTRELSRRSIVREPVCDIWGGGCPGSVPALVCPGGSPVIVLLSDMDVNCNATPTETSCELLRYSQTLLPQIKQDQLEITYSCSVAGATERPVPIPLVTVSLRGVQHKFLMPGILGIEAVINLPDFATSRVGEDMHSEWAP